MGWLKKAFNVVTAPIKIVTAPIKKGLDVAGDKIVSEVLESKGFSPEVADILVDKGGAELLAFFKGVDSLTKELGDDKTRQEALDSLGDSWRTAFNENPQLVEEINEQLLAHPELNEKLLSVVKNNPAALEAVLPQIMGNPQNLAETIQQIPLPETGPETGIEENSGPEEESIEEDSESDDLFTDNRVSPLDNVASLNKIGPLKETFAESTTGISKPDGQTPKPGENIAPDQLNVAQKDMQPPPGGSFS